MMTHRFNERTSGQITFTVVDQAGAAVPLAAVSAIALSLYDRLTGRVLNTRSRQNVLNTNNVTYHATSGLLTWSVQPADNAIVDDRLELETHIAEFSLTWTGGQATHKAALEVTNLRFVP